MVWVPRSTIEEIQVPSIILHGETDRIITLDKAQELASILRDRTKLYVFKETGHQVMQERPGETLRFIKEFVATLPEAKGAGAEGPSAGEG